MRKLAAFLICFSVAGASPVLAQGNKHHDKDKHKNKNKDHDRDRVVMVESEGGSPAFCRSGAGHPKYGRAWCIDKGFGLGNSGWDRQVWNNVVFQQQRTASIGDVLGSVILGRLNNYATSTLNLRTPLVGTWLTSDTGSRVYLVRSGSTQVAEFVDTNRDGRADYVLLHNR